MSNRTPTNVAASVRQRLLNFSKEKGEDFTLTLVRYAVFFIGFHDPHMRSISF